jgi:phosphatidylserine/phosphatidylglycerophosphate/cardiolipin synthase-like enzyme
VKASIWGALAYFIPDPALTAAMGSAALRGVEVA